MCKKQEKRSKKKEARKKRKDFEIFENWMI
jgi:hypothetical protein